MEEASRAAFSEKEWDEKCQQVAVAREDMNMLVMNFLVTEGYLDAAKTFQAESGTDAGSAMDTSEDRMHIRIAVEQGRIEEAIERVNDLDPEVQIPKTSALTSALTALLCCKRHYSLEKVPFVVLDCAKHHNLHARHRADDAMSVVHTSILEENTGLFFHLQQQQLIEYIRSGNIEQALSFAQEYLASKGEENPQFLDDIGVMLLKHQESTIALIAFPKPELSPAKHLLEVGQRQQTACELNAAILSKQDKEMEPRLTSLLKMLKWAEKQLEGSVSIRKWSDHAMT